MINGNAQAIGFEGNRQKGWSVPGVPHAKNLLRHFQADACVYDEVKPLFDASTVEYTTAICLGDVAGRDLPSPSRDARILSMLLLLRDLTADQMKPMHIIAENQEDRTLFFMCFSHFRRLVFVTLKWLNFYQ